MYRHLATIAITWKALSLLAQLPQLKHLAGVGLGVEHPNPWNRQWNKLPMTGNVNHTTYGNDDDWGMVYEIVLINHIIGSKTWF